MTNVIGPAHAGIPDPRPRQLRDAQQSCASQRANISLIDRRSRWPRRVPYLAIEHCNLLTARCGQDQLVSVDKESHIKRPRSPERRLRRVRWNAWFGHMVLGSRERLRVA